MSRAILQVLLICGVLLPALPARSERPERHPGHRHDATATHGFGDVERWVQVFDDPQRDSWQRPREVLRFLEVRAGQSVADLGAGTGYFTMHLAAAVGDTGTVWAVDIEPRLIDHVRERALEAGFDWVHPVLAEPHDPRLPEGALDLILVVNTWHHIDGRLEYLQRLAASLRPKGGVAIVDYRQGELPVGPPPGHKLSREEVLLEFEEAGWRLLREGGVLPYQYLLLFAPPATEHGASPVPQVAPSEPCGVRPR